MYKIANLSNEDRMVLFSNAAKKMNCLPFVVEKDFWVTIILDYLFNKSKYKDCFVFKGGTCLSKCYKVIDRFSEDIDLVLKWDVIDISSEDVKKNRSSKQREKFKQEIRQKTSQFLGEDFLHTLRNDLSKLFNHKVTASLDPDDQRAVYIQYPNIFKDDDLVAEIKLEIGCLSSIKPNKTISIDSYASQIYSDKFIQPKTNVVSISLESIFWEKVLILHQMTNKTKIADKQSRHFYDLANIYHNPIKQQALKQQYLFKQALNMTQTFYYSASLNGLTIDKLNLIPNEKLINELMKDYEKLTQRKMILDTKKPEFKQIIESIKLLQAEIKKLTFKKY